jgi:beta-lactamase class A
MLLHSCVPPTSEALLPVTTAPLLPTDVIQPTNVPSSTVVPVSDNYLPNDVWIAGVAVGGLTPTEAQARLENALRALFLPLTLQAGTTQFTLRVEEIGFQIPIKMLLAEAQTQGSGARVNLRINFRPELLRAVLSDLRERSATAGAVELVGSGLQRQFVSQPGSILDLEAAYTQIVGRLQAPGSPRRITLAMQPWTEAEISSINNPALLQQEIATMAATWDGTIGLYAYDLDNEQQLAAINAESVFSAASLIKIAIQLQVYIDLATLSSSHEQDLDAMMIKSANVATNNLLAALVAGTGTNGDDVVRGAQRMTTNLRQLGFTYTFLGAPFAKDEGEPYLTSTLIRATDRDQGPAPRTNATPTLQTTPAEIGRLLTWIAQCQQGTGTLLQTYPEVLTRERCAAMLSRMERVGDRDRMAADVPPNTPIARKGGWIGNLEAEAGIVRSPGGNFLLVMFVYQEAEPFKRQQATATMAALTRLLYTYYNPTRLSEGNQ